MKPGPKVACHHGPCHQCGGKGDVLTIGGNPLDPSLCGDCLAFLIADAAALKFAPDCS
jgi:hypothetical protein